MSARSCGEGLWTGIYCPGLPLLSVWGSLALDEPVAVHNPGGNMHLVQVSHPARMAGVQPGQRLSSALAILPALKSRPRNGRLEAQMLRQIALTAYGHSHQVVLAEPDTVVLEVGGSRRLRGSIRALIGALREQLARQGFEISAGSAPTPAAARMLARSGKHARDLAALTALLEHLPIAELALDREQEQALSGCGLETAGELMRLPAAQRARRFGRELNAHLDRITGRRPTPLKTWQPPEHFRLSLELPDTTSDSQALLFVFRRVLGYLGGWLEARDHALNRLKTTLELEDDHRPLRFEVGLSRAGTDRERLLELIGLKLEALQLPAPVAAVRVTADTTDEHRPPQADLFSGHNRSDAWPALLDRLGARLGEDGLCSLSPRADHRPERAWAWTRPGTVEPCSETRPRPAWLLPAPRPCRRDQLFLEEGPERIESGWWDQADCRRDYWIARDRHGRRLWVFREYKPHRGWFLHGVFG